MFGFSEFMSFADHWAGHTDDSVGGATNRTAQPCVTNYFE